MDKALQQHWQQLHTTSLLELFQQQPQRAKDFSFQVNGLYFDFSKNHLTPDTVSLLCKLAENRQMAVAIDALLNGDKVNNTEKRPALHTALRDPNGNSQANQQIHGALQLSS